KRVVTNFEYDDFGRVTTMVEAVGTPAARMTTIAYDATDNIQSSTANIPAWPSLPNGPSGGLVKKFEYDALNRNTSIDEMPDSPAYKRSTIKTYDPNGNLLSITTGMTDSSLGHPHPSTTEYTYDALNRVASKEDAVGEPEGRRTTFAYDAVGRLVSTTA